MSKRLRLLILIIFIVLGVISLYPTIKWYFFTTEENKTLATSNRQKIRQQAIAKAKKDIDVILEMLQDNEEADFLTKTTESPSFCRIITYFKRTS